MRMDAELDFATASTLERAITVALAMRPELTDICLFAQPINRIDVTGAEVFGAIRRLLESQGRAAAPERPQAAGAAGAGTRRAADAGPMLFIYRTDADALAALGAMHGMTAADVEAALSPAPARADA